MKAQMPMALKCSLLATIASLLLALSAAGTALADNWGAGAWYSDGQCDLGTIKSECTPEDGFNYYYFDSGIPSSVHNSFVDSFGEDYSPLAGIEAYDYFALTDTVDVRMRIYEVPDGKPFWMYTTCATDATISDGTGLYQACKKQVMRVDKTQTGFNSCQNSSFCRDWYACHETGHTFGLQHPGSYPEDHVSEVTCMDYDDEGAGGTTDLHPYDEDHLIDCFEKPNPAPATLTFDCRNHALP